MITQCTVNELYKTKNQEAIDLAKTFERRRCNHRFRPESKDKDHEHSEEGGNTATKPQDGPKSAFDCITSVVNVNGKNVHRYCVATQKTGLRSYFRSIPAVPLIYMKRSVMIMEPMSPVTLRARQLIENSKLTQGLNDPTSNLKRKPEEDEDDSDDDNSDNEENKPTKKKRKGPKQPNPLSIKKKKTTTVQSNIITSKSNQDNESDSQPKKKRRRKHHHGITSAPSAAPVDASPPASP